MPEKEVKLVFKFKDETQDDFINNIDAEKLEEYLGDVVNKEIERKLIYGEEYTRK